MSKVIELSGAEAFKSLKDTQGRFRTQSLFWEMRSDKYPAPFTLKNQAHKGRVSMYEKYMEYGDPTEYRFALAVLGSWRHWQALCSSQWFEPYISQWRAELKAKCESDRWAEMKEVAKNQAGTAQGVQATKWLAERYGGDKKRGRPSKGEKTKVLKEELAEDALIKEEATRLGLVK